MRDGDVINFYDFMTENRNENWKLTNKNDFLKSETYENEKLGLLIVFYGKGYSKMGTVQRLE